MKKQTKEPGLHRVGPNPWDYEYNPAKGQRVGFKYLDGEVLYGTVTDFVEDEDSGEIRLTVEPDDEELKPS